MRQSARYIHELPEWPTFQWDQQRLAGALAKVRHDQGRLIGRMEALGFPLQQEATLEALTEETVKSSEIEGERLEGKGVEPTIEVPFDIRYAAGKDPQLEKAVEVLAGAA